MFLRETLLLLIIRKLLRVELGLGRVETRHFPNVPGLALGVPSGRALGSRPCFTLPVDAFSGPTSPARPARPRSPDSAPPPRRTPTQFFVLFLLTILPLAFSPSLLPIPNLQQPCQRGCQPQTGRCMVARDLFAHALGLTILDTTATTSMIASRDPLPFVCDRAPLSFRSGRHVRAPPAVYSRD